MARVSAGPKILALLLLIVILGLGGALWFDFLGLVDVKSVIAPVIGIFGGNTRSVILDPDDILLLDKERLLKLQEGVTLQTEELDNRVRQLDGRDAEINQKVAELSDREKALIDQEKSINERQQAYENKRVNLEQNARYLVGMPPQQAVGILLKMEDQDMIDHLRVVEELAKAQGEASIVSFWLSIMPSDRAAEIQRKMTLRSGS